jgi:hypothetical protein
MPEQPPVGPNFAIPIVGITPENAGMLNLANVLDLKAAYDGRLAREADERQFGFDERLPNSRGPVDPEDLKSRMIDEYTQVGADPEHPREVSDQERSYISRMMDLDYEDLEALAYPNKPVIRPKVKPIVEEELKPVEKKANIEPIVPLATGKEVAYKPSKDRDIQLGVKYEKPGDVVDISNKRGTDGAGGVILRTNSVRPDGSAVSLFIRGNEVYVMHTSRPGMPKRSSTATYLMNITEDMDLNVAIGEAWGPLANLTDQNISITEVEVADGLTREPRAAKVGNGANGHYYDKDEDGYWRPRPKVYASLEKANRANRTSAGDDPFAEYRTAIDYQLTHRTGVPVEAITDPNYNVTHPHALDWIMLDRQRVDHRLRKASDGLPSDIPGRNKRIAEGRLAHMSRRQQIEAMYDNHSDDPIVQEMVKIYFSRLNVLRKPQRRGRRIRQRVEEREAQSRLGRDMTNSPIAGFKRWESENDNGLRTRARERRAHIAGSWALGADNLARYRHPGARRNHDGGREEALRAFQERWQEAQRAADAENAENLDDDFR